MKITVCGKGGSGKSTVTTMLAKEYAKCGKRVLVIDCDESNYGLHQQLGLNLPKNFTEYFGGKMNIMKMLSEGPQNMPKLFDKKWKMTDIPPQYYSEKDGVMLMTPGKIEGANEACACPFNAIIAQFIPMLDLAQNEIVIMDMEAGIEHFGRGTDNATDAILMVVDPSYESLKLSRKVSEICDELKKPVFYALNKVTTENRDAMRRGVDDISRICGEVYISNKIMNAGLTGDELTSGNEDIQRMIEYLNKNIQNF